MKDESRVLIQVLLALTQQSQSQYLMISRLIAQVVALRGLEGTVGDPLAGVKAPLDQNVLATYREIIAKLQSLQ